MSRRKLLAVGNAITSKLFKRKIALLPVNGNGVFFDVSQGNELLPCRYTYRATPEGSVTYDIGLSGRDLSYSLYTMDLQNGSTGPGRLCFNLKVPVVQKGDRLGVNLVEPHAALNDKLIDVELREQHKARKFVAELQLHDGTKLLTRRCSHYLPYDNKQIGSDYYFGDDYIDYPRHTNESYAVKLV